MLKQSRQLLVVQIADQVARLTRRASNKWFIASRTFECFLGNPAHESEPLEYIWPCVSVRFIVVCAHRP